MSTPQVKPRSGVADVAKQLGKPGAVLQQWGPWLALVFILGAGLFVAWAKMDTTQLTYEVHKLRAEQTQLQREQRLLVSDLATLRSPSYLSEKAGELGLEEPPPGVVIRVE